MYIIPNNNYVLSNFVYLSSGLTIDYLKIAYETPVSLLMGCILLKVLYRARKNIYYGGPQFDVVEASYRYTVYTIYLLFLFNLDLEKSEN